MLHPPENKPLQSLVSFLNLNTKQNLTFSDTNISPHCRGLPEAGATGLPPSSSGHPLQCEIRSEGHGGPRGHFLLLGDGEVGRFCY